MSGKLTKCLICEKQFLFVEEYCCDGLHCGCMGLPIDPPVCSNGCYNLFMLGNMQVKYCTPIKHADIKYLSEEQRSQLAEIYTTINRNRLVEGKKPITNYVYIVVNTDEAYSSDIIDILNKNNHWG